METIEQIEAEFIENYPNRNWEEMNRILNIIASDFDDKLISEEYEVYISREKIHQLQQNVFVTITSKDEEVELSLEFENGINNGTQLNEYIFGDTLKPSSRTVEVFKDIELDKERVLRNNPNANLEKAQMMLNNYRSEIIKMNRNQSYDDYVTGGGTNKTDKYYRDFRDDLNNRGLYWQNVYEEVKADINWVR